MRRTTLVILCLVSMSLPALAHRVIVFAYREGGRVFVESKFKGGNPVQAGAVTAYGANGEKLHEGVTDASGGFVFDAPGQGELRAEVYAGEGHQGEWTVAATDPASIPAPTAEAAEPSGGAALSRADLARMIEDAVEVKVAPLRRMLIDLTEKDTDWRDVLGGLGWIAGFVGIIAWFKAKRSATP